MLNSLYFIYDISEPCKHSHTPYTFMHFVESQLQTD